MAYLNSYSAPVPLETCDWHADTPLEAYDQNFAFALPPLGILETEGVRLEPLVVRDTLPPDALCSVSR